MDQNVDKRKLLLDTISGYTLSMIDRGLVLSCVYMRGANDMGFMEISKWYKLRNLMRNIFLMVSQM